MRHGERTWQAALLDLDGTLYRGNEVVPGAPEFVERLRQRGIRPVFLTNNSTRTPRQVADKLKGMGIAAEPDEVCTSAEASAHQLREWIGPAEVGFVGLDGLREALVEYGHRAVELGTPEHGDHPGVAAVVVGLDPEITYRRLAVVCAEVLRLGSFVLTNGDVRLPAEDRFMPGNGALGAFIETATGVRPYVAGKPNPDFVRFALQRYGLDPDKVLLIGDNRRTDVLAGKLAGVYTVQVESGVQYAEAESSSASLEPDEVHRSVADLFLS
ncbi:MAG: HAD-IIA family hydrolase [Alicyclobacillus macrosporangiidus]|uniref:HAD-IIA family hydrolase n=1 Tax=Alicyclobacillus macrosporangiidus TaxID=392015 RepID=UPI0026EDA331|nr:HAD-IIA family hydrolase [Alicyclobacillus macrosporangiidus]MCL6600479.1 HAD-IIA family hydrolase [Alicyclobacillus macrosporangiidus]